MWPKWRWASARAQTEGETRHVARGSGASLVRSIHSTKNGLVMSRVPTPKAYWNPGPAVHRHDSTSCFINKESTGESNRSQGQKKLRRWGLWMPWKKHFRGNTSVNLRYRWKSFAG